MAEKRPSKFASTSSGGGRKSGGIISKMMAPGLNENFGKELSYDDVVAGKTEADTQNLYQTPSVWQRLFAGEASAQADAANANLLASRVLSKENAALAYKQALALQQGQQGFANVQNELAQKRALELENNRAMLNEGARQREIMAKAGFEEDARIRAERIQSGIDADLGRAVWGGEFQGDLPFSLNGQDMSEVGRAARQVFGKSLEGGTFSLPREQSNFQAAIAENAAKQAGSKVTQTDAEMALLAREGQQGLVNDAWRTPQQVAIDRNRLLSAVSKDTRMPGIMVAQEAAKTGINLAPEQAWMSLDPNIAPRFGATITEMPVYQDIGGKKYLVPGEKQRVYGQPRVGETVAETVERDTRHAALLKDARAKEAAGAPANDEGTPIDVNPYRAELDRRNAVTDVEAARAQASDFMAQLRAINARIKAGGITVPTDAEFGEQFMQDKPEEQKKLLSKATALEDLRIKALSGIKGRKLYSK